MKDRMWSEAIAMALREKDLRDQKDLRDTRSAARAAAADFSDGSSPGTSVQGGWTANF